ncbi:hypothetical protein CCMSSC00406_0001363 [Pleurotus cornucopiae]|uniref:Uncharacterized protein n=1 Tax=Pleurotus cornucopiae TaxID=5321 RepID=A0ACB7IN38_PLECO|nr:hypothetical protein CCMSSC00406_0001363 [Pleurotus cornucopiae]
MDSVELLDKEIEECLEKARSLRELRNSQYSSTSRLPVDVLVLIFEALAFTKDPKSSEREAYSGSTGLPGDYHPCHNISHVCRSWRTLVLNMSAIWGIFYGDCSKKWMDSMTASRVKPNSPIFLRAPRSPIYKYSYKKQTHVLTFDAAKFGGLEVEVANHEIAAILHHIFRQHITLSVLTSLSLSWPTAGGGGGWRIQWNANAPRLEVMDFYNVPLRVTGGSFPMLQSFTMLFDFAWLYVTVVELLHALKAMPQLRSLKCTRIFADEHDPIPTDLQVQLPYLEHVTSLATPMHLRPYHIVSTQVLHLDNGTLELRDGPCAEYDVGLQISPSAFIAHRLLENPSTEGSEYILHS